ncbi:nucleotidyltransferase domain-containing protein [Patescibacteria group bacterium]|nr:nucleotidyltransferase domain-containing protein [Patescibacteria group bacterium]MCG2702484.1 nucleotidyltransferase domain-containing protein [Candidatus Parcubacteria bacterium]MBU4265043.1 nucleotidyltransferase domain-containing protein [Patescibacteria group bacterium]MBU4390196.1 nucleotidyltransferase domain-containing protein [Patescibacteria group bacterium]MBU4397440.1 nucleotidyltransferase domain-containing protein [Patescibacteria group bacterium]
MNDEGVYKKIAEIVFKYFDKKKVKAFVFGSRAVGKKRKFSDVDVGLISKGKMSVMKKMAIEEELEESNIPYTVDVVDFYNVDEKFKKIALKKVISLNNYVR